MTITQLIQSSPANANELFAKLTATTTGAVKTRESLFNELKAELELQARLEEEHLFPVLRKHKETKDLVRAAVDDNRQVRALLAELDGVPKEGEEFLAKVTELRKAFQQHVRDEKKELLPAVKSALSNEEAQAIADKVEADKAAVEQAKLQQAEERRAAARQEREKAERRQAQAEAREQRAREEAKAQRAREEEKRQQAEIRAEQRRVRNEEKKRQAEAEAEQRRVRNEEKKLRAEAEAEQRRAREAGAALAQTGEKLVTGAQSVVAAGAAVAQAGAEAAARSSERVADAASDVSGRTGALVASAVQSYSDRALSAMERLEALTRLQPVAAGAAAETGKTWLDLMGRTAESGGRRSRHLLRCFTPQQVAEVQTRYLGESMQAWFEANTRMLDISIEAYRGMMQPVSRQREGAKDARKSA